MNKDNISQTNVMGLLPLTVILWLGYLLALALIDHTFYPRPVFPPVYYMINGFDALVVWGLAYWNRGRTWLGYAFLPLMIVCLSIVPAITGSLIVLPLPRAPSNSPEAIMLRQMPLLLLALILTAWQYGWRYVMLFSGGFALFTFGVHLFFFRPGGPPLLPPMTVVVIQTISFLVVGYFISMLMKQLKQQQDSLAQANVQLTDYAATLEDLTISRERNRMARELHDTLAHTLSGLSVQLETVKAYWNVDPAVAQRMLDSSLAATRAGLQETRRALKSLRASPLEDLGLLLALRQMATETAARANVNLTLAMPEYAPPLSPSVEQCIYRVAQEAAANVAYHANARTLNITLSFHNGVLLHVSDDGQGFNLHQAEPTGHFGLTGMHERAALVGGTLTITSLQGQGTTIQLFVKD